MGIKEVLFSEESIEIKEKYLKELDAIINKVAKHFARDHDSKYVGVSEMNAAITAISIIISEEIKDNYQINDINKFNSVKNQADFGIIFKILVNKWKR